MIRVRTDLLEAITKWAGARGPTSVVAFRLNDIVAVDGHRAVFVPMGNTDPSGFSVDVRYLRAAIAAQRALLDSMRYLDSDGKEAMEIVSRSSSAIRITLGSRDVGMLVPRGNLTNYPSVDRIIPSVPNANQPPSPNGYTIDPRYLADIDHVNAGMGCSGYGVRVESWGALRENGERDAILLSNKAGARFVIMPIRDLF